MVVDLQAIKKELAQRELERRKFYPFFQSAWKVIEPATDLKTSWATGFLAEYGEAAAARQVKRLLINIPPRNSKSSIWSISFPAWVWLRNPHERFMMVSYGDELTTKLSADRKTLLESDFYAKRAPADALLVPGSNKACEYYNSARGGVYSTTINASSTGFGCNFLVIDDPQSAKQGESKKARETTIYNFEKAFSTRLNDKKNDVIIIIQQRLHERDLTGHILAEIGGYEHVRLPAIAEQNEVLYFPISKKSYERKIGDLLNPEYEDEETLKTQRLTVKEYGWASQYQQRPAPQGGGIIKWAFFIPYKSLPEKFDQIVISADTAAAEEADSCPWAILCFGIVGGQYYLLDLLQKQMLYPEGKRAVKEMIYKWNPNSVLIENKSTGQSLIPELKLDPTVKAGIVAIDPQGSKQQRIFNELTAIESGRVRVPDTDFFPELKNMVMPLEAEVSAYPKSVTVDTIDALSQFLMWVRLNNSNWLQALYGAA